MSISFVLFFALSTFGGHQNVSMKFVGGSVSNGSELQIEVAEFLWKDVEVTIKTIIFHVTLPVCTN